MAQVRRHLQRVELAEMHHSLLPCNPQVAAAAEAMTQVQATLRLVALMVALVAAAHGTLLWVLPDLATFQQHRQHRERQEEREVF